MNTSNGKSVLGTWSNNPVASAAPTSTKTLASWMLAAAVAALVVLAEQLIDDWAETHTLAAWLALWAVAVLAIAALRGVTRLLAQKLMTGLDAWSAGLARRRADQRLWAMAQTDSRLMRDLQTAIDRSESEQVPAIDLNTLMTRRVARMIKNHNFYL